MDYTIRIAGEAGQGLQTMGAALAKIFSRMHYHVFTHQDYMSRIRGGHNIYQIRISDKPISASRRLVHIVIALNKESIDIHFDDLHENGIILFDPADVDNELEGDVFLPTPFESIAEEVGGKKIMVNSVAIGAVLGVFDLKTDVAKNVISESLKKKSPEIVEGNTRALEAGFKHARDNSIKPDGFHTDSPGEDKLLLINGTQAIAFGAIASGCKFYSAYPMTPATGIMVYLANKAREHKIIVEQGEDEICAINMALGASYAGVRSMTGTSGGGYSLMTEGVSLAGMTETPIVICEMQRPGPATGLPTRTEQSDLFFLIHGGHGEFPRIILTPGTPEQAFLAVNKAFELAEKYQIPAFIQGDQYLGDCEWTCQSFDFSRLNYQDQRLRKEALEKLEEYRRYSYTESGISPLAVPGESEHLVVVDSDEHDEEGHIIEDSVTRNKMVEKRLFKKMAELPREISPPEMHGAEAPETVLICYGSTYGVVKEVVDRLRDSHSIAMLHFSEVYPFPLSDSFDYISLLEKAGQTVCVEHNATGQFARLMMAETGFICSAGIKRFDGHPFTSDSLLEKVLAFIEKNQAEK